MGSTSCLRRATLLRLKNVEVILGGQTGQRVNNVNL